MSKSVRTKDLTDIISFRLTKYISTAYFIVRTDKIFKIGAYNWHIQKDFNISVDMNFGICLCDEVYTCTCNTDLVWYLLHLTQFFLCLSVLLIFRILFCPLRFWIEIRCMTCMNKRGVRLKCYNAFFLVCCGCDIPMWWRSTSSVKPPYIHFRCVADIHGGCG